MNLSDDESSGEEYVEQMFNKALSHPRSEESDQTDDEITLGNDIRTSTDTPVTVGRNLSTESSDEEDDLEHLLNQALTKPEVEDVGNETVIPDEPYSTWTDQDKNEDLSDEEDLEKFLDQALSKNSMVVRSVKPAQVKDRVHKRKSIRDLYKSKAKKRKLSDLNCTGAAPQADSNSDGRKPPVKRKTVADSSQCPTCNLRIRTLRVGGLDGCDHIFCMKCIPRNTDRCPVDKIKFSNIITKDRVSGKIVKTTRAKNNKQNVVFVCELCGLDDKNQISCDGCNKRFHIQCLPSVECVSVKDWFCSSCEKLGNTSQISNALKESNSLERSIALQRTIRNISKKEVYIPKLENKDQNRKEKPNSVKVADVPQSIDLLGEILKKQEELYGFTAKKSAEEDDSPSPSNSGGSNDEPIINNNIIHNTKKSSSKIFFNTSDKKAKIRIIEQVAQEALKPYFLKGVVNKDQYKYIMSKVVPKVLNFGKDSVDPVAVAKLVMDYVTTLKK